MARLQFVRRLTLLGRLHCDQYILASTANISVQKVHYRLIRQNEETKYGILKTGNVLSKHRHLNNDDEKHTKTMIFGRHQRTLKLLTMKGLGQCSVYGNAFDQGRRHFQRSYHSRPCIKYTISNRTTFIHKRRCSSDPGNTSDSDEVNVYMDAVVLPSSSGPTLQVDIVPGKGPPPEPPVDCCMSGCANCVWIQYAEELKNYFTADQGLLKAQEAIETIENPGLKMFLKLELGLL